jgi:hypothetical protein
VALASSLTALVFQIWPGLRPDPRAQVGGAVSVFAVEPDVTQDAFLQAISFSTAEWDRKRTAYVRAHCTGQNTRTCAHSVLGQLGEQIDVQTSVAGFKWRSIGIRASLYYANNRRRDPALNNVNVAGEQLDAPSDSAVIPIWMPCPENATKTYFARVELFDSRDDVLLAVGDSKPFRPSGCYH